MLSFYAMIHPSVVYDDVLMENQFWFCSKYTIIVAYVM